MVFQVTVYNTGENYCWEKHRFMNAQSAGRFALENQRKGNSIIIEAIEVVSISDLIGKEVSDGEVLHSKANLADAGDTVTRSV